MGSESIHDGERKARAARAGNRRIDSLTSAKKSRIRTLKEAVQAIAGLPGWVCWLNDADRMVRVRKPRFVGSPDEDVVTPTADVVTETPSVATDTMGVVTEPGDVAEPNAGATSERVEALI